MNEKRKPHAETVRILGITYSLVADRAMVRDGHDGEHDAYTSRISLDPATETQYLNGVFCHEVVEAINSILELGLPHAAITALGAGLYQFIVDNPKLVNRIQDHTPVLGPS